MQPISALRLIALTLLLAGCTPQSVPEFDEPVPRSVASSDKSLGPRLAQGANEVTILSWMERDEAGATLKFSSLENGEWQAPVSVVSDPAMFVNWADMPAITPVRDDLWIAHWLSYSADAPYAYDVMLARSNDHGQSWTDALHPHADGTPTEHGFVSVYPGDQDAGLLWLDGRKTIHDAGANAADNGMALRSAMLAADGSIHSKLVVDELVCDCCQTDVAVAARGPVAVYRDRTADEIRDIYVSRFIDGQWQAGFPIANDGWNIAGCPVNGPAIDADDELVVVAWFTAAENKPLVQVAVSKNSGKSFSSPIEIPSQRAIGRVDVAIVDRTGFAVSWLEPDGKGSYEVNIRGLTIDGQAGRTHTVGRTELARIVPQMVRVADKLVLAWPDKIGDSNQIQSVEVSILGFYDR